jgi:hypothetical protein
LHVCVFRKETRPRALLEAPQVMSGRAFQGEGCGRKNILNTKNLYSKKISRKSQLHQRIYKRFFVIGKLDKGDGVSCYELE